MLRAPSLHSYRLPYFLALACRKHHTTVNASPATELDQIHLRGLVFHGYHGVYPEENKLGQKFVVDATLHCDLTAAGQSDDLHDTVNYAAVHESIRQLVEGPPHRLLESLAAAICRRLMQEQPLVQAVRLQLAKPHVAVPGVLQSLGIEVFRTRSWLERLHEREVASVAAGQMDR